MKRHRGFSLIELLVVVAIICLLVSILMPALGKVRELTRRAVCCSNLHQMGVGFHVWADAHDGNLPKGAGPQLVGHGSDVNKNGGPYYVWIRQNEADSLPPEQGRYRWYGPLGRYEMVSGEVFYCPSLTGWYAYGYPATGDYVGWLPESQLNIVNPYYMVAHYWNRTTFGNPWRPASIKKDSPGKAIASDQLRAPQHVDGYPVLYLDGSASFRSFDPATNPVPALCSPAPPSLWALEEQAYTLFFDR